MSAPALSPVENKPPSSLGYPSMELVRFSSRWKEGVKLFFRDLKEGGDEEFFSPHPSDDNSINQIANYHGKDLYYLLVEEEKVLGYGMLRGWDEGYSIPSLGVAIHSSARGEGLGKIFMHFLHVLAFRRGASKVRLRVHINNDKAIGLYKNLGYVFEEDTNQADYLVGFKSLEREWRNEI
ncbi:MAG: GNAT family N-acetyltransferase [Gallionella sp.]|jgi:ribosomal protein S18 acetylase RimI-like enzyme|nr:GNAT family N-acetyltransferase [Gallionella sp.]